MHAGQNIISVATSEAGLCLTTENWQEAKVDALSYSLEFLLHKPGYKVLQKIVSLAHYVGWSKTLILNAASLKANREGVYHLKSPYDGSKTKLSAQELLVLIHHLNPEMVLLPKNIYQDYPQMWEDWQSSTFPFMHADDLSQQMIPYEHGVYFDETMRAQLEQWSHLPRYVMGALDESLIHQLRSQGIKLIESDEPAKAALHGQVYSQLGMVDLTDKVTEMQFEIIDTDCVCPSCIQKFTKAYFYHLLQNTPLLCQRFLIQHNLFWMAI
ncbi:MAG: queuine tRNA-ribosyltransferase [Legionella sp.]|uniref:queuine tRNA-ribosyltransferase n=1 Tax=Legionella sp. TaxID=459 RepID=UPI0039E4CE66